MAVFPAGNPSSDYPGQNGTLFETSLPDTLWRYGAARQYDISLAHKKKDCKGKRTAEGRPTSDKQPTEKTPCCGTPGLKSTPSLRRK